MPSTLLEALSNRAAGAFHLFKGLFKIIRAFHPLRGSPNRPVTTILLKGPHNGAATLGHLLKGLSSRTTGAFYPLGKSANRAVDAGHLLQGSFQ